MLSKAKKAVKRAFVKDSYDTDPYLSYNRLRWKSGYNEQNYDDLNDEYKHNAIARRIVAKPAEDATRNGWRLVIPDDPKKQDQYQDALDKLRLNDVLSQQLIYQRLHGDGYINVGVKEDNNPKGDTGEKLKPENVKDVTFVHAFGQNHVEKYQYNDDPTNRDYKKEQAIVINPTNAGTIFDGHGMPVLTTEQPKRIVIDRSRYFHISLDKFEDDYVGTSIVYRCREQLKAMDIALNSTGKMLREFTFKAFKSDAMMDENDEDFEKDKERLSGSMESESIVFMRKGDELIKVATPLNGINTLFDFAWQNLSAACNIPRSVLTGEQAGSLAGASQDVVNYYDTVKSMQETLLKPEIEYIIRLLMYADEVGDGQEDPDSFEWHVEFNPLWSPDDKTQSETLLNHVNAASTLVGAGIYDADEARQMLDGQGNNAIQGMQSTTKKDSSDEPTPEQIKQYQDDVKKANHGKKA